MKPRHQDYIDAAHAVAVIAVVMTTATLSIMTHKLWALMRGGR